MFKSHSQTYDTQNDLSGMPTSNSSNKRGKIMIDPNQPNIELARIHLSPESQKALADVIKQLNLNFTDDEIDQMMAQKQCEANIEQLSTQTIKTLKQKKKCHPTIMVDSSVTHPKTFLKPKPIRINKKPKAECKKEFESIHWLDYQGKRK